MGNGDQAVPGGRSERYRWRLYAWQKKNDVLPSVCQTWCRRMSHCPFAMPCPLGFAKETVISSPFHVAAAGLLRMYTSTALVAGRCFTVSYSRIDCTSCSHACSVEDGGGYTDVSTVTVKPALSSAVT